MQKWVIKKRLMLLSLLAGASGFLILFVLAPEQLSHFINVPGIILVVGGMFAAILVCRPAHDVKRVLRSIPDLFDNKARPLYSEINQLLHIADHYRHGHLRTAEEELSFVNNDFLRSGVQQVLDGTSIEEVHKMLHWHKEGIRTRELADAQILRLMSNFAPAFGMLGTLLGLIHMLHNLDDSSIASIGSSMGFAMITTLYGIIISNLLLKPLVIKKLQRIEQLMSQLTMLEEGIIMLHQRQHPMIIKDTLDVFANHQFNNTIEAKRTSTLVQIPSVH